MAVEIDCRGFSCPIPVIKTKEEIEKIKPDAVQIIVDNNAACQNVSRFLNSKGFEVSVQSKESDFIIIAKKNPGTECEISNETKMETEEDVNHKKIVVMITSDKIGHGDDSLGLKLMINFIKTLKEMGTDLWKIIFVNNGVKLTTEGSEALLDLKALETEKSRLLVCGTCLNHFNLLEKKKVGETTNMLDIVTAMQAADNVINI